MENYQKMVKFILRHITQRELSAKTGNTERAVKNWLTGSAPQNIIVQEKIKRLYKRLQKDEQS